MSTKATGSKPASKSKAAPAKSKAAPASPSREIPPAPAPETINSLSKLYKFSSDVKRAADTFDAKPAELIEEDGFNPRGAFTKNYWEKPEVVAHIRGFAEAYKAGRHVPPIVVIVRNADIIVRDGAHRRRGLMLAISEGAQIQFISVIEFKGDEMQQDLLTLTSAQGKPLAPLDRAVKYAKYHDVYGWTDAQIAATVNMTAEHVRSTRKLMEMPYELKALIAEDIVKPTFALELWKDYGTKSLEYINQAINEKQALPEHNPVEQKLLDLLRNKEDEESVVQAISDLNVGLDAFDESQSGANLPAEAGQTGAQDAVDGGDSKTDQAPAPVVETPPAAMPKVKITGKDLKNILPVKPKLSKATVEVLQRSFTSLTAGLASAKVDGDGFLVRVSAHDYELLRELKERLAAESAPPTDPNAGSEQPDLLTGNDEKKEEPLADE